MYENGLGVQPNDTKAAFWYQKAADNGYAEGQCYLGDMYRDGAGVDKNFNKALEWYRKAEKKGYALSMVRLGEMYQYGWGKDSSNKMAKEWYEKAAKKGNDVGQCYLGNMYRDGIGVKRNYAQAKHWYVKAAQQGNKEAKRNLAYMYESGQGVLQDYSIATDLYLSAADQGDSYSQINLASMYKDGRGVRQNYVEAKHWYEKAAEQKSTTAQCNLALFYYYGVPGVSQDDSKAAYWFEQAAAQGNVIAQKFIAFMYYRNRGVPKNPKNYENAAIWFRQAAERSDPEAQNAMGWIYELGHGVNQDYKEAIYWYKKAADNGNSLAALNLGQIYEFGKGGLPPDLNNSLRWYREGEKEKSKDCQHAIVRISKGIFGILGLQQLLAREGYSPGAENGILSQETTAAVKKFYETIKDTTSEDGSSIELQDLAIILNYLERPWGAKVATEQSPSKNIPLKNLPMELENLNFGSFYALVIDDLISENDKSKHCNQFKELEIIDPSSEAIAVSKMLSEKYGFKVECFSYMTRDDIIKILENFRNELKPTDNFLIYYAGEGTIDKEGKGYWVPKSAEKEKLSGQIANKEITDILIKMKAKHILIIADTCYSGALLSDDKCHRDVSSAKMRGDEDLIASAQNRSLTGLTSGGIERVEAGGVGRYSVFANSFLSVLGNNNKIAGMATLFPEIRKKVYKAAKQTPEYEYISCEIGGDGKQVHPDGDFVFVPSDGINWAEKNLGNENVTSLSEEQSLQNDRSYRGPEVPMWNAWFVDRKSSEKVDYLVIPKSYRINIDISDYVHNKLFRARPDERLSQLIDKENRIELFLQPIIIGQLITNVLHNQPLEGKTLIVDLSNKKSKETKDGTIQERNFTEKVSPGFIASWDIKGISQGCANLAVSVWDRDVVEPLDHLLITIPVSKDDKSLPGNCVFGPEGKGMQAGLDTLLREPTTNQPVDGGLHVFETLKGTEKSGIAVFVNKNERDAAIKNASAENKGVYAWQLSSALSEYISKKDILEDITTAHVNTSKGGKYPYQAFPESLANAIFDGMEGYHKEQADRARNSMNRLKSQKDNPIVVSYLYTEEGDVIYLPLGLMNARTPEDYHLKKRFTFLQKMPRISLNENSCIDTWAFAIPKELDGLDNEVMKMVERNPNEIWLDDHMKLNKYLKSAPEGSRGEGFILLAHHSGGSIWYTKKEKAERRVEASGINHNFQPGSAAVIIACTTSGASAQDRLLVRNLNRYGIEVMAISPFAVEPEFGARLALEFQEIVRGYERIVREKPEKTHEISFQDVFKLASDKASRAFCGSGNTIEDSCRNPGYQDMALEFQVIGRASIPLCPTPQKKGE